MPHSLVVGGIQCNRLSFCVYPDITLVDENGHKYAIDIKSTYRKDDKNVNGMTLGAFTGYFRDRKSSKNIPIRRISRSN